MSTGMRHISPQSESGRDRDILELRHPLSHISHLSWQAFLGGGAVVRDGGGIGLRALPI